MARQAKQKKIELYTVRNSANQKVAAYKAISSEAAIQKFWNDQYVYGSFFKGQAIKRDQMTAKVE